MEKSTKQAVLLGARQCFFQHGYSASNMTLISQYTGYSRVTVHKYLHNKDDAFRQVCQDFQINATQASQLVLEEHEFDCWQSIRQVMLIWMTPTFEEVSDEQVMGDLKYHAQTIAKDIFDEARKSVSNMCAQLLNRGIQRNEIQLSKLGITSNQLSDILVACLDGVRGHMANQEVKAACDNILKIYELATQAR
ncbi:TetR/AcrR family transcriptional regulator [Bermanella marisrubri]|uniref:Uncharacterized protein n=1 Tax=Bermanella marisrubri TaxID=207949 RepID=Q1N5I7_9GAMM|nr:TetR/AcrR family transcriptional regulator [Bermanella marisrubri]EAT13955.1 hypothetical protein RED65_11194 [Oceanobacter sp. RED65] [Bermanella marisrubri]QIZ84705.1 TetR/AcrR family transcriptional regulator [Bermanella marisrubri]